MNEDILINIPYTAAVSINASHLKYMAFNGENEVVYSFVKKLKKQRQREYFDKYVFASAIHGGLKRINILKTLKDDVSLESEIFFIKETLDQFVKFCSEQSVYPREVYSTLLSVTDEFVKMSLYDLAMNYLNTVLTLGVEKFPELRVTAIYQKAFIYNSEGKVGEAHQLLSNLIEHPYMISDRNKISDLLFKLSHTTLKKGDVVQYKKILFLGLRYFYTNPDDRRKFFEQLKRTYKSSLLLLFSDEVSFSNKSLFAIHLIFFKRPNLSKIKLEIINRVFQKLFLGIIYFINYYKKGEPINIFTNFEKNNELTLAIDNSHEKNSINNAATDTRKKILITRAMGGIGDFLMMTPAFHELKKKYSSYEIHLAIPKRYFSVFEGNDDVILVDIENEFLSHLTYKKWFNFTDCPAARVESRTVPKVNKSRIEIFASSLGINKLILTRMDKTPRYFIKVDELKFANEFWKNMDLENQNIIGFQLHSDESYRDYPLMEKLVEKVSENYKVLIFDSEPINGYEFKNVIKIQSLPLRKVFALVQKCNVIVAPDSSFVHLAAAFQIPTVALFGPIDGKIRTKHYPNCKYINSKEVFGCMPCWRNEVIPCKLTGMRGSICMNNIPLNKIINEIESSLNKN